MWEGDVRLEGVDVEEALGEFYWGEGVCGGEERVRVPLLKVVRIRKKKGFIKREVTKRTSFLYTHPSFPNALRNHRSSSLCTEKILTDHSGAPPALQFATVPFRYFTRPWYDIE